MRELYKEQRTWSTVYDMMQLHGVQRYLQSQTPLKLLIASPLVMPASGFAGYHAMRGLSTSTSHLLAEPLRAARFGNLYPLQDA